MNKILTKTFNLTNIRKYSFFKRAIINNHKVSDVNNSNINKIQKRNFNSVDYSDIEKKLDKFYEMQEKSKIEYLKSVMTENEKREAELIFKHLEGLDELEKDYFKVKLESEMKKIFEFDLLKKDYTFSNYNMYAPIEVEGIKFAFGDNLQKNIAPFYGQSNIVSAQGLRYIF